VLCLANRSYTCRMNDLRKTGFRFFRYNSCHERVPSTFPRLVEYFRMPIQLEFSHGGLGVIYRCEGVLGLQHFSVANDRLLASPERMRKLKHALIDAVSMEPTIFSPSEGQHRIARPPDCIICRAGIARCSGFGAECCFCTCPDVGDFHRGNRVGNKNLSVTGGSTRLDSDSRKREIPFGYSLARGVVKVGCRRQVRRSGARHANARPFEHNICRPCRHMGPWE